MVIKNPNEYKWKNSTNTDGTGPDADFSLPSPNRLTFNPDVPRDIDFLNETLSAYLVQLKTEIDEIDTNLGPDGDTDTKYEFVVEDGKLRLKGSDGTESDVEITAGDSGKLTVTIDNDNNTIELDVDLSEYYTRDEVDTLIPDAVNLDNYYTKDETYNKQEVDDAIDAISTPDNIVNLDDGGTRDVPPTDRIVMYVGSGEPSNWNTINEAIVGALFTSSSGDGLWIKEAADADGWIRADDTEYTEHLKGGETNQVLAKASEDEGHYVWKSFTLPDGQEPYPGISDEDGNEIQIRGDGLFVPEVVIPEIPELPDGIATEEYVDNAIDAIEIPVAAVYDSGWQTINGQKFRRVNYTVFGQGTISTPDVADLTDTEFVPTHPISVSAHYDADKTISNPVYSDGPLLKVNSQNGEDVVWSGSWSTNAEIPGLPDDGGSSATVTNLVAEPTETSVTLTWDVE